MPSKRWVERGAHIRWAYWVPLTLGMVAVIGCGKDTNTPTEPKVPPPPLQEATSSLVVQTQPGSSQANAPFPVQPVIEIQDLNGNLRANDNSTVVTATIASGSGTLQGQVAVTSIRGIVSYGSLAISGSAGEYRVAFSAQGMTPTTSLAFPLSPGTSRSSTVGNEGGSIVLGDGASFVIPKEAIDGEILVEFQDTSNVLPLYEGLSDYGYTLDLRVLRSNTNYSSSDSVRITIPIDNARLSGGTSYVRAVFSNLPDESFVAPVTLNGDNTLTVTLPANGLAELNSTLLGDHVFLYAEEVRDEASPISPGVSDTPGLDASSTSRASPVECNEYPVRRSASSKVPQGGLDVAIILVPGWNRNVASCLSFAKWQSQSYREALTGEAYFEELLSVLEAQIGEQFPIYAFTYPSFRSYEVSGDWLAQRVDELQREASFRGVIFVGHSMGGLVARQATRRLVSLRLTSNDYFVRGVITLGTPHLGTPFPSHVFAGAFRGVPTDGGQSLLPERALDEREFAPIFAYGGDISNRDGAPPPYGFLHDELCDLLEDENCQSDGVVPLPSAVPSFITRGRNGPVLDYSHPELYKGLDLSGDVADPLYQSILTDIITAAEHRPPTLSIHSITTSPDGEAVDLGNVAGTVWLTTRYRLNDETALRLSLYVDGQDMGGLSFPGGQAGSGLRGWGTLFPTEPLTDGPHMLAVRLFTEESGSEPAASDMVTITVRNSVGGSTELLFVSGPEFVITSNDYPQIYTIKEDGSSMQQLTNFQYFNFSDYNPRISPDGSKIVFVSKKDGNLEIYTMKTDGTDIRRLTDNSDYVSNDDFDPDWSPDGQEIVFVSNRSQRIQSKSSEIYLMNSDGSNQRRLDIQQGGEIFQHGSPGWSPNGQKIAFDATGTGSDYDIYIVNKDGTGLNKLTNSTFLDIQPSWSPDGTRISFTSKRDGNREIYVVNSDGTNERRLTNHPEIDANPSWSPDGTRIVFISDRFDGYNNLHVMNSDGSGIRRIVTKEFNNDSSPSYKPWS